MADNVIEWGIVITVQWVISPGVVKVATSRFTCEAPLDTPRVMLHEYSVKEAMRYGGEEELGEPTTLLWDCQPNQWRGIA